MHPATARVCARCKKTGPTIELRCAACKVAYYCSKQCQTNDWKNPDGTAAWHKMICGSIKNGDMPALCELVVQIMAGVIKEEGEFALDQFPVIKQFFMEKRSDKSAVTVLTIHFSFGVSDIVCLDQFALNLKMWIETAIIKEAQSALEKLGMQVVAPELPELLDEAKFGNKNLVLTVIQENELDVCVSKDSPIYQDWTSPENVPCFLSASAQGTSVWASQRMIAKRIPKPASDSNGPP